MPTLTLRPNGDGYYFSLFRVPDGPVHYTAVDEVEFDASDRVADNTGGAFYYDSFTLENHGTQEGPITAVRVHFRVYALLTASQFKPMLRLSSTDTIGTQVEPSTGIWTLYSEALARPGGGSFSWADIDNLQAGIGIQTGIEGWCGQLWVEVDWVYDYGGRSEIIGLG